jgi:hypothetical protein
LCFHGEKQVRKFSEIAYLFFNTFSEKMKLRRRTPLQADGVSKAPPHESGTR